MARQRKAYTKEETKRLVIYHMAEGIRAARKHGWTCSEIAHALNRTPSTKLRKILNEMICEQTIIQDTELDAGIAGFRFIYSLNEQRDAFNVQHSNARYAKRQRILTINSRAGKQEVMFS